MNKCRSGSHVDWDEEFDVVIVGFGCAGACAAIEASDRDCRVLVIDRFKGGGATRMSGGVIYAGGGSAVQRIAGFKDSVGSMRRYLAQETGGGVDQDMLADFCVMSLENLAWLEKLGVSFPDSFYRGKTTQPPGGYGLYFSGNERQLAGHEDAVPRGHVPLSGGMSGKILYHALEKGVRERGMQARYQCKATRLVLDESGSVAGIEMLALSKNFIVRGLHSLVFNLGFIIKGCGAVLRFLEAGFGTITRVRVTAGVVICAGGFIFNREMMHKHAPLYGGCMPLGTPGDDGGGIMLGQGAGAAVESLNNCAASRFFCPPETFVSGILVNQEGRRFCDETLYGATISRHITLQPKCRAYLVIDSKLFRRAKEQMRQEERLRDFSLKKIISGEINALIFRKVTAFINMRLNREKAFTLSSLERKCRMPVGSLQQSIEGYNEDIRAGRRDGFGKAVQYREVLSEPPFYAIDCRLDNALFPSPCFTLGGLKVHGKTSQVLRQNGSHVPGLFAAGRSAAGVCSRSYVSGLSLADCIFRPQGGRKRGRGGPSLI